MAHIVELRKATPEENNRRYDEKKHAYFGESFDRGERVIMVDGERWGRTYVHWHGCNGTSTTFHQDHGSLITARKGESKEHDTDGVCVRSMRKRRYRGSEEWRSTDDLTLDKVRELVANNRLIHPDRKKEQNERASALYLARCAERDAEKRDKFLKKACEVLQINDPTSDMAARVVEAMEWAQSQ